MVSLWCIFKYIYQARHCEETDVNEVNLNDNDIGAARLHQAKVDEDPSRFIDKFVSPSVNT